MIREQFVRSFTHAALSPDPDLAIAALMIARIEYPKLDAGPYLDRLDALGEEAKLRGSSSPISELVLRRKARGGSQNQKSLSSVGKRCVRRGLDGRARRGFTARLVELISLALCAGSAIRRIG